MRALATLLVLLALAPPTASAQTPDESARIHFQAGALHYERGNYEKAIEEFKEAYRLTQRAALLYNLAQAYEKLGELRNARDHLQRYLDSGQADAAEVEPLREKLRVLDERIAAADAGAPRPPRPARPYKVWKWVGAGVTLASAAAATWFALDASAMASDLEDAQGTTWNDDLADKEARGERDVVLGWVFGGVALASAAVTTWMLLADAGDAREEREWGRGVAVLPALGDGTVGASVLWRF